MFSEQASFLISLGNKSQVPIITFSATSPSLASTRSPYFIQATTNDSSQVDAAGALVKDFGCREVVPIYADDEFGKGIIPFLSDAHGQVNARIRYRSVISALATDDQVVAELYKLMTMQKRVFIVHMLSPLSSHLFSTAEQRGTMTWDYAWIITDGITDELSSTDPSAIESMLGVKPYVPKTKELDDFTPRYNRRINPRGRAQDLDIFGLQTYDSAMALATAAEKANLGTPKYQEVNISRNYTDGFGISDAGLKLIQDISSTTFKGLARNFNLVIDGQLQSPSYEIVNIVGPGARGIGYWRKKTGTFKGVNFTSAKSTLGLTIWPGNALSSPKGWVIPTNRKTLRVGVPVIPCFVEFVRATWNSDNSTKMEGYCIDVFDAVMKAINI